MTDSLASTTSTKVLLKDCCEEISQRIDNPAESGFERFVGLEHLKTGDTSIRNWGSTADVTSSMKLFKTGDVIVARRNVYLRRAARAHFDGVCSGDGIVLRGKSGICLPDLLPFLLNTDAFWDYVTSQADGTMSKRITVTRLLSYEFALPPLEEQRRIIEALQAVETTINSLDSLVTFQHDQLLPSTELSLVQAAERQAIGRPKLGTLADFHNGFGFKSSQWTDNGLPIIRIQNLNGDREFNYFDGEVDLRWNVKRGDLLFAWSGNRGTSFGPRIWLGPEGVLNQHIFRVVPNSSISRDYLFLVLKVLTRHFERRAHGGVGLVHVTKTEIVNTEIALPDATQQESIARHHKDALQGLEQTERRTAEMHRLKRQILEMALSK